MHAVDLLQGEWVASWYVQPRLQCLSFRLDLRMQNSYASI